MWCVTRTPVDVLGTLKHSCTHVQLGWSSSTDTPSRYASILRPIAWSMVISGGDEGAIKEALYRFERFCDGETSTLPPDLRVTVYRAVCPILLCG